MKKIVLICAIISELVFALDCVKEGNVVKCYDTQLMWQDDIRTSDKYRFWWDDAREFCKNLELDGYKNWRLPTKEELDTIASTKSYNTYETKSYSPSLIKYNIDDETIDNVEYIKHPVFENVIFDRGFMYWSNDTDPKRKDYAYQTSLLDESKNEIKPRRVPYIHKLPEYKDRVKGNLCVCVRYL